MRTFVRDRSSILPLYTSHNAHPTHDTILHRYVPWDFDADEKKGSKLDDTLADVLHWREWALNRGLVPLVVFSGGRGFHGYCVFQPQVVKKNDALVAAYVALQTTAEREAKLRTSDPKIVGDVRRILRIVNAPYVGKDGAKNGLYTVEIPDEILLEGSMKRILEYAKEPRPHVNVEPKETFFEAMKRLDFRPVTKNERAAQVIAESPDRFAPVRETTPLIGALFPRPCIASGIMSPNPAHVVRLEFVSTLVQLGYNAGFILDFVLKTAEAAKWVDRDASKCGYFVGHTIKKGGYNFSCTRLRAEGCCIGSKCEFFSKVFPEEAKEAEPQRVEESTPRTT